MNISENQLQLFGLAMIFYAVVAFGFTLFFEHFTREAREKLNSPPLTEKWGNRTDEYLFRVKIPGW